MSVFTRPIQRLKSVESILKNNFIDTEKLYRETLALREEPVTHGLAEQWEGALKLVAPELYRFGRDMLDMQLYLSSNMYSLIRNRRFIWVVQGIVTVTFMMFTLVMVQRIDKNNQIQSSLMIGIVVAFSITMNGALSYANASINESYRLLRSSHESPLFSKLAFLNSVLGTDYLVVYTYAIDSGINISQIISEYVEYNKEIQKASLKNCPGAPNTIIDCNKRINECQPLKSLVQEIKSYCTPKLAQIAQYLNIIKQHGSMHVNQVLLWKAVDVGMNAVGALTGMDITEMPMLDKESVNEVIETIAVPELQLNAVFVDRSYVLSTSYDEMNRLFTRKTFTTPDMAFRMVNQNHNQIGIAYIMNDKDNTVFYTSPANAKALWSSIRENNTPGLSKGSVVISKHIEQYHALKNKQEAWMSAFNVHSEYLISKMTLISRRYRYMIDLRSYRAIVDNQLLSFYGEGIYESAVSPAITMILSSLKKRTTEAKKELNDKRKTLYVDSEQLIDRIRSMAPPTLRELDDEVNTLHEAALNHLKLFPVYQPTIVQNGSRIMSISGILTIFVVTCALIIGRLAFDKKSAGLANEITNATVVTKRVSAIPFVMTVISCMVIIVFIIESVCKKRSSNAVHNNRQTVSNTEMLTQSIVRVKTSYFELRRRIDTKANKEEQFIAASNFMVDVAAADQLYNLCNSYTTAKRNVPAPVTEMIIYAIIGALIASFGSYAILAFNPGKLVSDMRLIRNIKGRMISGDSTVMTQASNIIMCLKTYDASRYHTILIWFGAIIISVISMWFALAAEDYNTVYNLSIYNQQDCVE
jgi:hypothetical protein